MLPKPLQMLYDKAALFLDDDSTHTRTTIGLSEYTAPYADSPRLGISRQAVQQSYHRALYKLSRVPEIRERAIGLGIEVDEKLIAQAHPSVIAQQRRKRSNPSSSIDPTSRLYPTRQSSSSRLKHSTP